MNISYLSTFYPFRGGIAQFNAALYREFEKNHNIKAFTFTRQYPDILFPGNSQYVTESDKPDILESHPVVDSINPFSWMKAAGKIKDFSPELQIMKFWMPFFGPSLGYVSGRLSPGCKSIAIMDNVIPHERRIIDMPFLRYFLKRVDGFVVMSEVVKNDLLKMKPDAKYILHEHPLYDHFGEKKEKEKAAENLKLDKNKKTLLFFGFIRDYKGLDLLIDAFGKLDDSYQLVIAGESYGSFDKYDEQIKNNPNKQRIHKHVRYIDDNDVPDFFSAADVCILPYKSATQSGITSIAYNFELPMIATDVGGLKELVIDKQTGLIIPEASAESIKEGIQNFFISGNINTFRENIKEKKEKMTWESLANSIINLYHRIKND